MKIAYKLAIFVFLIGWLMSFGCIPKKKIPITTEPQKDTFSTAERMYRGKSYQNALSLYNEYLNREPNGPNAPLALMRIGDIYTNFYRDYPTARGQYKYLIDKYPKSELIWDAKVQIPATYFEEKRYKDAIQMSEELLTESPQKNYSAKLNTIIGDSYLAIQELEKAVIYYAKAHDDADKSNLSNLEEKIKLTVEKLSKVQISSLLGSVQNNFTRGYLMFYMAKLFEKENNSEAAQRVLTQLHQQYPDNIFSSDLPGESQPSSSKESRVVGVLLPLSGTYKNYGKKALRGIEFAMTQYGGSQADASIRLVVKDTESDDRLASERVQELANENCLVIIGPVSTTETAAQEAQRIGIPIITLTQKERITDIGDFVFRHFITPELQVKSLMKYLTSIRGFSRFGILYPEEQYGENFMNLFWQEAIAYNVEVISPESYGTKVTDFSSQIRRIRNSSGGRGIDALFLPEGVKKSAMIIPQLAFYDIKKVILIGTNLWHSQSLIKLVGSYVQGAIIPDAFFEDSSNYTVQNFVRSFKDAYGETPDLLDAIAYDTAMMVFQTINRSDIQSRSDVKAALMQVVDYEGVTGKTSFGSTRDAQKQLSILEIQGNRFVEMGRF